MFKLFFRSLINVTEPTTGAALRRPATAERNARGEKARERYIEIAAALKAEAGITRHTAHKKMSDRASLTTGAIFAPAGTTRKQLYVLAHECGHIALHFALKSRRKPRHVEEHEAESYAHRGLEVPEVSTWRGTPLCWGVPPRRPRQGIPICPLVEAFAMGRRSPYASLRSVDAFRRPTESGPEMKTCATCRHRSDSQCDAHLARHYLAWRGPCDYGRRWRPLRPAVLVTLIGAVVGTISGRWQRKSRR